MAQQMVRFIQILFSPGSEHVIELFLNSVHTKALHEWTLLALSFGVKSRIESTVFPVDNVHFQQAAQISKALVEEEVDFEAMVNIGSVKWEVLT